MKSLSKADVRRALVRHQFALCEDQRAAFNRLRSIQFDPIAPAGCNHDLVLQARVPGYKVGDWEKLAYEERFIYDGWDKQASLVPFSGWPLRRIFHGVFREQFQRIFNEHPEAVEAILKEIESRGPLMPKECEFQDRREDWKGSWYGPSVAKQTLRALWGTGQVMTSGRRKGQHVYDLTERVVPPEYLNQPKLGDDEAKLELMLERHQAMGLIRPTAAYEVWSYGLMGYIKKALIESHVKAENLVPVDVEGVKATATPEYLQLLDQPSIEPRVVFVAPLDQLLWDRKMTAHVFSFDYIWEIYTPEAKRKWGYYVLPILFGDDLVARIEFYCRSGILEIRQWHEEGELSTAFYESFEKALLDFMGYCGAKKTTCERHIDKRIKEIAKGLKLK